MFLDLKQRRALLAAAGNGALRDLLEAAMLTGARAGELVYAMRSQFDARTGSMLFTGKPWAHSDWDELVRAAGRNVDRHD